MSLPVFRAAGAKTEGTGTAITPAAPAGVATGDLEIIVASCSGGGSVLTVTNNGGSAWTVVTGGRQNNGGTAGANEDLYYWWRVRQAGDGNPQIGVAGPDHIICCRLAYQAGTFDETTPIEIEARGSEVTNDASFSWAPGTTTGGADRLVLVISNTGANTNTAQIPVCTNASLASLASRANYCTGSTGTGGGFGVTEGAKATAGTVGTFACTYVTSSPKAYLSFAIRPMIALGPAGLKTVLGTPKASVKTIMGLPIGQVKTWLGLP